MAHEIYQRRRSKERTAVKISYRDWVFEVGTAFPARSLDSLSREAREKFLVTAEGTYYFALAEERRAE